MPDGRLGRCDLCDVNAIRSPGERHPVERGLRQLSKQSQVVKFLSQLYGRKPLPDNNLLRAIQQDGRTITSMVDAVEPQPKQSFLSVTI